MYYCQSRYYDPELCRFISEDDESYHEDEEGAAGTLCLLQYDPVNNSDRMGMHLLNWSEPTFKSS
jgi:RHS repeat-associated protein